MTVFRITMLRKRMTLNELSHNTGLTERLFTMMLRA